MQALNYHKLMSLNPTIYDTLVNREGQEIVFVEHPLKGDEYPVIIVYHAEKLAVCSDFFETTDMMGGEDYEPIYQHGQMNLAFELGY